MEQEFGVKSFVEFLEFSVVFYLNLLKTFTKSGVEKIFLRKWRSDASQTKIRLITFAIDRSDEKLPLAKVFNSY